MSDIPRHHERILAAIQSELWAIHRPALDQIIAIAQGLNEAPEAVAAKLGRPLDNTHTVIKRDSVAVVPVTGPIFRYANLFTEISGATSIQRLATDFGAAVDDPAVESIVLEVDSPGGQVAGVSEFAAQVRAAAARKRVVAYVSNMGASAGYWIPSAASEVVIADTAVLGSIGAVMQARVGKQDGVVEIVSSQSPDKRVDAGTEEGRAKIQSMVDAMAQVFIESVARYRGVSVETVLADFGRGGLFVGQAAVDAGLANRLGSLESIIAELSGGAGKARQVRGQTMPQASEKQITREMIAADHPDIASAFREEGFGEGYVAGAQAELERIQAVEAQTLPGHETLIAELKFDGKTSGPEAAVKILQAENAKLASMTDKMRADAPKPVPHAETPVAGTEAADDSKLPLEDRCKAEWDSNPDVRAEFKTVGAFMAFRKIEETNKAR